MRILSYFQVGRKLVTVSHTFSSKV